MPIQDRIALEKDIDLLLRQAQAIQRRLETAGRTNRGELARIKHEIRVLESITGTSKGAGVHRSDILDGTIATKNVKTVLIVDKHPAYTRSLIKEMQYAGLKTVVASTAEGGLRKVEECHPDLILLELELSDMDGLKVVSEIRRNRETEEVPIVAMSTFPHFKARCFDLGCNEFLLKPFRMTDFTAHVRKYLDSD